MVNLTKNEQVICIPFYSMDFYKFWVFAKLNHTSSGYAGPSLGTNLSITGNTLTVTGEAIIQPTVIENHLTNSGSLTVTGTGTLSVSVIEAVNVATGGNDLSFDLDGNAGDMTIDQAISVNGDFSVFSGIVTINKNVTSTTSGSDILVQARENIVLAANRTIGVPWVFARIFDVVRLFKAARMFARHQLYLYI